MKAPLLRAFVRADRRALAALGAGAVATAALAAALLALVATPPAGPGVEALALHADPAADADGDGLLDLAEVAVWGTSPANADSDGDGLPDAWEAAHAARGADGRPCPDPSLPDAARDCRGKGLTLAEDHANGTAPGRDDSDGDGIPDAYEAARGMDPRTADADRDPFADGLTHAQRHALGARGDRVDTACSGMTDGAKARAGLDPARASTGGSGVPDGWALHWGLDPRDPSIGALRLDGDPGGLTVLEKARASFAALPLCATPERRTPDFARGLDPRRADSDGDGLPDAWEVRHGLDPLSPADAGPVAPAVAARAGLAAGDPRVVARPPAPAEDLDGDGLSNLDAFLLGACPDEPDCDGDGLTTREEALEGWLVRVEGEERRVFGDPLRAVSDGDRVPDGAKRSGVWEVGGRVLRFPPLDPSTPDTDGDGLPDAREVADFGGLADPTRRDSDADGLDDGDEAAYWEARAAAQPDRADALCPRCSVVAGAPPNLVNPDSDGDGLRDGDEVRPRPRPVAPGAAERAAFPPTDPASADTDDDGLPDPWEAQHARFLAADGAWDLDPSEADSLARTSAPARGCPGGQPCRDGDRDLDDDGLANRLELAAATDPHDGDTDGDGLPDGWEHAHGAAGGARVAAGGPEGRGWAWLPRAGSLVPLLPTDPSDAARPLATLAYVRFTHDPSATAPGERLVRPAQAGLPARVEASLTFTYLDAHRAGASPEASDSDRDGLPDLWEWWWSQAPPGRDAAFAVGDGADGAADPDRDGLTNAEEFRLGTDPFEPDTDGGGVADALERDLGLDPLDPGDDAADGDLDGDGLSNAAELRVWRTRVDHPDTDGDGLADGPSLTLPAVGGTAAEAALRERLLDLGVAYRREEGRLRFLGEHEVATAPERGCARAWSCSGDGLPDAWKVYHGLAPLAFHAPGEDADGDGVGLLQEYRWGRPAGWDEARDGTWWLGLDPTRADTNGDGVSDADHAAPGRAADLDRDGLHDLSGEDPFPFVDGANRGDLDVRDRRALFAELQAREAARGPVPPRQAAAARLVLDAGLGGDADKGEAMRITGRLEHGGVGPLPAVPVVVRLVPAEDTRGDPLAHRAAAADGTFGLGFAGADGLFEVELRVRRAQEAVVPAGVAALFGAPAAPGPLAWEADASALALGRTYRVLVASYGVADGAARLAGAAAWAGEVRLVSAARFAPDGPLAARPGETAEVRLLLTDGAGDPYPGAREALVELEVGGRVLAPSGVEGARVTFHVPVPADAPAEAIPLVARYGGDAALRAGSTAHELAPRLVVALEARADPARVATGQALEVEGRLADARGPPLAGMPVAVRFAGAEANATTSADGRFAATLVVPPDARLGARQPSVAFAGDRFHEAAAASAASVAVVAEPTFVDVAADLRLGEGGEVRGRLLAAGRPVLDPLSGGPPRVRVLLGAFATGTTPGADGAFRVPVPAAATPVAGALPLRLGTEGSDLVLPASHASEAAVVTGTRLAAELVVGVRGAAAEVRGRLLDAAGAPVPDAPVEARLSDGAPVERRTDAAGAFTLALPVPADASLGPSAVHLRFAGRPPAHGAANATVEARVLAALRLDVGATDLPAERPVLEGQLFDDTGAPVADRLVRLRLDGAAAAVVPTRADGSFAFAVPVEALGRGPRAAEVAVEPDDATGGVAERVELRALAPVRVAIAAGTEGLAPGRGAVVRVLLTAPTAASLSGRVAVALDGAPIGEGAVGLDGVADVRVLVPRERAAGPATLTAAFAGAPGLAAASARAEARVRSPAVVEVEARAEPGLRVAADARTAAGEPLAGMPLLLHVPGLDLPLLLTTDGRGRAEVAGLPRPLPGEVRASFPGTADHLPAEGVADVRFHALALATTSPALPWGALSLAALGAALAAAWRLRAYRRALGQQVAEAFEEVERRVRAPSPGSAAALHAYAALADLLALRGLLPARSASPAEVRGALLGAFDLDAVDVDDVLDAFEAARYGGEALSEADAERVLAASRRIRGRLAGAAGVPA